MSAKSDTQTDSDKMIQTDSRSLLIAVAAATALLLAVVAVRAWGADDAFITLRTVDNFVHGFGLRYNLDERVQAFTHPLWALLLSAVYTVVRSAYWTLLGTSFLTSCCVVFLLAWRLPVSRLHALMVLGILGSSQAFVDYSTSGLENPLTHLLVVLFALRLLDRKSPPVFDLALIAALATFNRMDTLLIFLPALALVLWRQRSWRTVGEIGVGFLPFFLWEAFSVVYYGFPFPNTAYAKLGAGIPRTDLMRQGLVYLQDSLANDPVTVTVFGLAVGIAFVRGSQWERSLASGGLLYLAYVVNVGGDFMRGRFLSPLIVLAVVLLARAQLPRRSRVGVLMLSLVAGLGFTWPRVLHPAVDHEPSGSGVFDERAFYRDVTAITSLRENPWVLKLGPRWEETDVVRVRSVRLGGAIGLAGFEWGPEVHVVDILGLADPLLARLPTQDRHAWRIGHFERKLPLGYLETLRTGTDQIVDPQLAEYYQRLERVIGGALWSRSRWRDIVFLNSGDAKRLIDVAEFSKPYSWVVPAATVVKRSTGTTPAADPVSFALPARNGILLQFDGTLHCAAVDLGLAAGARYRVTYYASGEPVVTAGRKAHYLVPYWPGGDIQAHRVEVPEEVAIRGYDAVLVFPIVANESSHHAFVWVDACVE
ncbi:MAG: hypothetical protein K8J08_09520 [Thermoanaerobaculia bacterium]|nr:hypothetical protein [Thermoanaerobaculia bacterium]